MEKLIAVFVVMFLYWNPFQISKSYRIPPMIGVTIWIFLWDKKKEEFVLGEDKKPGEVWKTAKTLPEAYVKTAKHINKTYPDYECEVTKNPDGGTDFKLTKNGMIWDVIYSIIPDRWGGKNKFQEDIDPNDRDEVMMAKKEFKKYHK